MNHGRKTRVPKARLDSKSGARSKADDSANAEIFELIGDRLRIYFDDVAKQPVPERFSELLDKLEKSSPTRKR